VLDSAALRARLHDVRDRIARAASRAGRDPASVRLVAVSKTFSVEHIRVVADAGQIDFGENKVQEGLQKIEDTADLPLRWHLLGHLQSNKAKKAVAFHTIHSIDSAEVLRRVDDAAAAAERTVDALVQVDLAGELTKHGAPPEQLEEILATARTCRAVRLTGLMLLPPAVSHPDMARPFFLRLRELRNRLISEGVPPAMLTELSMGMSHDFEIAVEEGATIVRVGSAIFGGRPAA
jgi:pyridoxal phosphate enzyme (YggS family)